MTHWDSARPVPERTWQNVCLKWVSINLGSQPVCREPAPLATRVGPLPCFTFSLEENAKCLPVNFPFCSYKQGLEQRSAI